MLSVSHSVGHSLTVKTSGTELATYRYAPAMEQVDSPRPYLHPVRTLAGDLVTVDSPHDHSWHRGLSWAWPNVGPHSFWGGPTFIEGQDYVQLPNNGSQLHQGFDSLEVSEAGVRLQERLTWLAAPAATGQAGGAVVAERRDLGFGLVSGDAWWLSFDSTVTNLSGGRLDLGSPTTQGRPDAGYGGLFWRGPREFTGTGVITTPDGVKSEEAARAWRGDWMAFTGRHDQSRRASTLLWVCHSQNPASPSEWFVRSQWWAALCPAPFFNHVLGFEPGQDLRFRYVVLVANGELSPSRAGSLVNQAHTLLGNMG